MDTIITHVNVDLDAVFSLAAAREFIPGAENANILFLPANWNGKIDENTLILDMDAGGRGIKGLKDDDGTVHSCFKTIIEIYASVEDQEILAPLVLFVDVQDMLGSVVEHFIPTIDPEVREMFGLVSINSVLRAFQAFHKGDDALVSKRMEEIFLGRLYAGRSRRKAELEASKIPLLGEGKVAIVDNARHMSTTRILFDKYGVRVIIYLDGYNIGLIRNSSETLRMDHPDFRAVVEDVGEAGEWFAHSAGFIYCHGSRKAPKETPSEVDPLLLAQIAVELLD